MNITIATFISGSEKYSNEIVDLSCYLMSCGINCELIIFSDKSIDLQSVDDNYRIRFIKDSAETKYKRLIKLFQIASFDNILCIDNDIHILKNEIKNFIVQFLSNDYIAGWGKIDVSNSNGVIPELIHIDKILSHFYIRPTLWKFGIGISLPGQFFMVNRKYINGKLPSEDTLFDDLQLGLIVKKEKKTILCTNKILCVENPKTNLNQLVVQRIRWAKGYADTILNNLNYNDLFFIFIHGFFYHVIWVILFAFNLLLICCFNLFWPLVFTVAFLSILLTISKQLKVSEFLYICLYWLLFPLLHFIWLIALFKNLIYKS